jgi:endonuclease YncB( thermonuclease family)
VRRPTWALIGLIGAAIASWLAGKPFGPGRYADPTSGTELTGTATAIDGDSIRISGKEMRLRGIDAPEGRQDCTRDGRSWPCGREAAAALRDYLRRGNVTCRIDRTDQYGRGLAVCRAGGVDINAALVAQGHAVAIERGVDAIYLKEEQAARRERRGLWQGEFTRPNEWRRQNGIGGGR